MRIAHFSDTHLGYRNYSKLGPTGVNQREIDVFAAFKTCLNDMLEFEPDVILHTGDFFDSIRPSNHTLVAAFRALASIQAKRVGMPLVIVAGNHETPRSVESGSILRLFNDHLSSDGIPGVYVEDTQFGPLQLHDFNLCFYCVPSSSMAILPEHSPAPDSGSKINIVAAHGLESNLVPVGGNFELRHFKPERWDYLALGDYHIHKALAENAVYSGATEFTTTNIWEEAKIKKGWVLFDTDSRKWDFHAIRTTRAVYDLPEINAEGLSPSEITEAMAKAAKWSDEELPIVRQRVLNVSPAARAEIKVSELRPLHEACLYYKPDFSFLASQSGTGLTTGGGRSLTDNWRDFATSRSLPNTLKREDYVTAGVNLLKEATHASEEA